MQAGREVTDVAVVGGWGRRGDRKDVKKSQRNLLADDSYKHTYTHTKDIFKGYYPITAEVAGTMPFLGTWAIR